MARMARIAISLPRDLLHDLEGLGRATKETRNTLIQRAARRILDDRTKQGRLKRYVDAYTKCPERPSEIAAAEATATHLLAGEACERFRFHPVVVRGKSAPAVNVADRRALYDRMDGRS
jgi:hypothetical protein